jgi:hypothetical protein
MSTFATWSAAVERLLAALARLETEATRIGVPSPRPSVWYDLLCHKLQPQLELPPVLVVAVVGGTNIGKSAVFNHLAGEEASASSPLAAGTKHPVCLVPPGLEEPALLARLFAPFELTVWHSATDALVDSNANRLFWRVGRQVPPRLLLLDVPDVDSDAVVNWERARAVRDTADVLVAVLTQQKYNDAAVKQFFREAVAAEKPIIVLFNQCDLEGDRPYWPQWLATFTGETGARPELVYVVPYDRTAAQALRLPFFEVGPQGVSAPDRAADLRQELAALHFDTIKIRTFRGAMARVLDPHDGVPAYLEAIRAAADSFATATAALSAREMARVAWPSLPPSTLVDEIRAWWDAGRASWSRQIHGFYRTLGRGVTWPVRAAWNHLVGPTAPTLDVFHQQERQAIVLAVEKMLDELDRLAQVGNETLRPRLLRLLGGRARQELLARVQTAHAALPAVDDDYRQFLWAELDAWRQSSPRAVSFLRSLDHVAAVARPAITISLAISGWVLAGDLVGHVAVQAAQQTAGHLATEAVIAGGIAGGGEALVSTTGEGVRQAAARLFLRIQARYAQQRAEWLATWLERELLGDLLAELRRGAEVPQSEAFAAVVAALGELEG